MSSKKLQNNWGIEEEYFPFKISIAPLSDEDLMNSKNLTPTQRLEWLLMMQKLLLKQYGKA